MEAAQADLVPRLGLGYTMNDLSDARYPAFSESTLTLRGDLTFSARKSRFEVALEGYTTAYVLSSTYLMRPQFGNVSGRLGYQVVAKPSWAIVLSSGWSYSMMRTEYYGYDNMPALLLRAAIQKKFTNRSLLTAFARYAPAYLYGEIAFFKSSELAAGIDLTFASSSRDTTRSAYVAVDIVNYSLLLTETHVTSKATSIVVGMRF